MKWHIKLKPFIFPWYFSSLMTVFWDPNPNIMFDYFIFHIKGKLIRKNDLAERRSLPLDIFQNRMKRRRQSFIIMLFEFLKKSKSLRKLTNPVWQNSVNWATLNNWISFGCAHGSFWVSNRVGWNSLHIWACHGTSSSSVNFHISMLLKLLHLS